MDIISYRTDTNPHKDLYYNYRHILGYQANIFGVIGARGIGKTYGAKQLIINRFLKDGSTFIWLRDTETSVEDLCKNDGEKFFKDMPNVKGKIKDTVIIIDKKVCGYVMAISTFYKHKGSSYGAKFIVFDEFIPEKGQQLMSNRVWKFINTLQTVGRLRTDYKVILLANALERGNDILGLFGVNIKDYGYYYNKTKKVVIHYAKNSPKFEEETSKSVFGMLIKDTQYSDNLIENKFQDEDIEYYDKLPKKAKVIACLHNSENSVRVYYADDMLYINEDYNKNAYSNLRFTSKYSYVNSQCSLMNKEMQNMLLNAVSKGMVLYNNAAVRMIFLDIVQSSKK